VRLGLRQRVALWCAALVVVSGVAVVLVVVVLSGRYLAEANRPENLRVPVASAEPSGPAVQPSGPARIGPTPAQVAQRDAADRTFDRVRNLGLLVVGGLMVVSLLVAWLVAGRIVRPLRQVTDTARSIGRDRRLDRRIAFEGPPDEIHDLADEFDTMLDRLEGVFDAQKAFVANTSHELRTPLAVLRAEVDVALDDPDASATDLRSSLLAVGDVVDRTSGLVTAMLALARAESITDPKVVDLAGIVASTTYEQQVRNGDRSFRTELAPAPVAGDPILLGQLVGNLVRNATTYNIVGGEVLVRTAVEGDVARLVVENDGPIIDAATLPGLFSRFVRRTRVGEGHGLGLAICEAIVRTHGGTIGARARVQGGLIVTADLPLAAPGQRSSAVSHFDVTTGSQASSSASTPSGDEAATIMLR
jgi:signal transduction histidine kinase